MIKQVLIGFLLSLAGMTQVFASSCVVSEYAADIRAGIQVASGKPLVTPQNVVTSSTSAQIGSPLSKDTRLIELWCDTQSAYEIGTNPTASATVSVPLSAGGDKYVFVNGGELVAFILRP